MEFDCRVDLCVALKELNQPIRGQSCEKSSHISSNNQFTFAVREIDTDIQRIEAPYV